MVNNLTKVFIKISSWLLGRPSGTPDVVFGVKDGAIVKGVLTTQTIPVLEEIPDADASKAGRQFWYLGNLWVYSKEGQGYDAGTPVIQSVLFAAGQSSGTFGGDQLDPMGGNERGIGAVDFQKIRSSPTQVASGNFSLATGQGNTASGVVSFATGFGNTASGGYSSAIGQGSTASGFGSLAAGLLNTASGFGSLAAGRNNTASGNNSFATGSDNNVTGNGSFATGSFATVDNQASPTTPQPNDHIFKIGNGSNGANRSDAFRMLRNGNAFFFGQEFQFPNLPTSASGLPPRTFWDDAGTVKITPA